MFGKEQPDVVNEDDVGNLIKELHTDGMKELDTYISGEADEVVGHSPESTAGTQDPD